MNALKLRSLDPVTVVVKKVTYLENAPIRNLAAEVVGAPAVVAAAEEEVVDTLVVAAEGKNATNAGKSGTSLATAPKVVAEATAVVGTVVVDTAVVPAVVAAEEVKHATLVADSVTCLVTALRVRSATTVSGWPLKGAPGANRNMQVAKSVICLAIVPLRPQASVCATSASSRDMSRLLAPTERTRRRLA